MKKVNHKKSVDPSYKDLLKKSGFSENEKPVLLLLHKIEESGSTCDQIQSNLLQKHFPENQIEKIKICLYELLSNAFIHGNQNDPLKHVAVLYVVSKENFKLSIIDEGEGFDREEVPSPLSPENQLKESGRGVFMVKRMMDKVSYNKKGNRVFVQTFRKNGTE